MSLNIKDAKLNSSIPPIDAGTYGAVCCGIIDAGLQETEFNGKKKVNPKVIITWEIPSETVEVDGELKPRNISNTYTFSTYRESSLRKMLQNWRGKDFTDEEMSDFSLTKLLGVPCILSIISNTRSDGCAGAKVGSVSKMIKGMIPPIPSRMYYFDMDDESSYEYFKELPEWMRDAINNSVTFRERGIKLNEAGVAIPSGIHQNEREDTTPDTPTGDTEYEPGEIPFTAEDEQREQVPQNPVPPNTQTPESNGTTMALVCADCGKVMLQAEHSVTTKKYGRAICRSCQKTANN